MTTSPGFDIDRARLASRTRSPLADTISRVLDPLVLVPAAFLVVACRHSPTVLTGMAWAALAIAFAVVLPYAALVVLVVCGFVDDRHVVRRRQRLVPMAIATISMLGGVLLLGRLGAPRALVVLEVALVAGAVAIALVTVVYKASVHTGIVTATGLVVATEFSSWWTGAVAGAIALIGWARVRTGRHTWAQVVAGAVVGGGTSWVVYAAWAG